MLSGSGIYASHSAGGIAGYTEAERRNINSNTFTGADFEVGNDALSLELVPAEQTVRAGEPITDIQVSSDNAAAWSFRVSGDYALGLISQDMAVSGTIPAGTQASTYTIIADALNSNGFTASAQAYITVTGVIIESGDVISGDIISGDITSDDKPTPTTPDKKDNVDYAFEIPSGVMYKMSMLFGGETVYQFTNDEINSDVWDLDAADARAIADMNENVVLHLPVLRPKNSGLYMLKLDLSGAGAGKKISLYGITSGGNVRTATLEELEYVLLDENGNEIAQVPENGIVYAALRLTANREHRGVITTPIELERGTIQPVEPDEALLEKIADPQEPTDAIRSELAARQNELLGKFNTLTVDKSGYYVLKVTLSDNLYERVKGVSVNELNV